MFATNSDVSFAVTHGEVSPFLGHVWKQFNDSFSRVIFFSGQRVQQVFHTQNSEPHVMYNGKLSVQGWKGMTELLINSLLNASSTGAASAHLHCEEKIGDLFLLIIREYAKKTRLGRNKMTIVPSHEFRSAMESNMPPVVLTTSADENWGFLSTGY